MSSSRGAPSDIAYQSMKDKVIAVTGGASGIAFSLCQKLIAREAIVCIADINPASIQTADNHFKSLGVDYMITQVDVSNRDQVDNWIKSIISKYNRLDGAANCAGVVGKHHGIRAVTELDDDEWDRIMRINLTGLMYCLRAQLLVVPDGASIVNVASILGVTGKFFCACCPHSMKTLRERKRQGSLVAP